MWRSSACGGLIDLDSSFERGSSGWSCENAISTLMCCTKCSNRKGTKFLASVPVGLTAHNSGNVERHALATKLKLWKSINIYSTVLLNNKMGEGHTW